MSMRMEACGSEAMAGSRTELLGMVSMAMQAVPDSFLFPFPFLKPTQGVATLHQLWKHPLPQERDPRG